LLLFARARWLQSQAWPSFDWLFQKKKLDKTNGYFLFGGVTDLAIVGYIVYVNSG
jgi:hypothetical protein